MGRPAIIGAFTFSVPHNDIDLGTMDGIVIIFGTVDGWSEYNVATEKVCEGSARSIINDLTVK
ncbi:MAG: hypothetical protein ABI604_09770 [Nitrospirota bacterium]